MMKGIRPTFLSLILALFATAVFMGCSSGGTADSGPGENSNRSTVALFLADGPTDEFDHVWIEVLDISLLPQDEGEPVVIYESESGTPLDLLTLQDEDMLLAVNSDVPTGDYNKIRLTVERVYGQRGDQVVEFHMPSKKIDLNPKGIIHVSSDETLSLRLDIDAEKSIHVSGDNYNFRPVVFVDAGPMAEPRPCHHLVKGDITELIYAAQDSEKVIGFRMSPFKGRAGLDVYFQDDAVIFDEVGQPADPEALAVEQSVCINGELSTDGGFLADMVVIGDVQALAGEVKSAVQEDQFFLGSGSHWDPPVSTDARMPDDADKTIVIFDTTVIMTGNEAADAGKIQPGLQARVIGKMDADANTMNAIAVYLKERRIKGRLTAMEAVDGGHMLTIVSHMGGPDGPPVDADEVDEVDENDENDPEKKPVPEDSTDDSIIKGCYAPERELKIFLPQSAPINIKGGSEITLDALMAMVECGHKPAVYITVAGGADEDETIQASSLTLWPEIIHMTVEGVDMENRTLTGSAGPGRMFRDSDTVQVTVPEATPIWKHSEGAQEIITLQEIQENDTLMVTALITGCDPRSYEAVTIVAMPGCVPPDEPCEPKRMIAKIKVAALDVDADGQTGTIQGENDALIEVTAETVFSDRTQPERTEMAFGDLAVGDLLVCEIIIFCDAEAAEAMVITRVTPEGDKPKPPQDDCMPHDVLKEVVVEETDAAEGIIFTVDKETIQVAENAQIYLEGPDGEEKLTFEDLNPGDVLEIKARQTCKDGPALIAYAVVKQSVVE